MNVFCVGPEQIDALWPQVSPHLARLEDYLDVDETLADFKDASKQLWGLQCGRDIAGVVVTRITGRTCEVVGGAGTAPYDAMRELHTEIEKWAKSLGCSRMRIQGRKGWLKLLKYTQTGIVAEKEL